MPTTLTEWFRSSILPYLTKIKATFYTKTEVDTIISGLGDAGEANIQADWNQSDTQHDAYILNKPDLSLKADLDGTGKVPASQLPTYVDDVLEFADVASFPVTGEVGVIYIPLDTNVAHRWSGSTYIELSSSAISGDALVAPFTVVTQIEADNDYANA